MKKRTYVLFLSLLVLVVFTAATPAKLLGTLVVEEHGGNYKVQVWEYKNLPEEDITWRGELNAGESLVLTGDIYSLRESMPGKDEVTVIALIDEVIGNTSDVLEFTPKPGWYYLIRYPEPWGNMLAFQTPKRKGKVK